MSQQIARLPIGSTADSGCIACATVDQHRLLRLPVPDETVDLRPVLNETIVRQSFGRAAPELFATDCPRRKSPSAEFPSVQPRLRKAENRIACAFPTSCRGRCYCNHPSSRPPPVVVRRSISADGAEVNFDDRLIGSMGAPDGYEPHIGESREFAPEGAPGHIAVGSPDVR